MPVNTCQFTKTILSAKTPPLRHFAYFSHGVKYTRWAYCISEFLLAIAGNDAINNQLGMQGARNLLMASQYFIIGSY